MEQQKGAFHELGIESQLLEDFLLSMSPFRPKVPPQFPPPECLYKKRFAFLPAPLSVLQKTRRSTDPGAAPKKKDPGSKEKDGNPPLDERSNIAPLAQKEKASSYTPPKGSKSPPAVPVGRPNRFGVLLVENSKPGEDDEIVIPEHIESILRHFKKSASCNGVAMQQFSLTDSFGFSKDHGEAPVQPENGDLEHYKWIEDLLRDDPTESSGSGQKRSPTKSQLSSENLCGPLLPSEAEALDRVSTPVRQQFYKVSIPSERIYANVVQEHK